MHSPRTCKHCQKPTMEFVAFEGLAFCDTTCLVDWARTQIINPWRDALDSAAVLYFVLTTENKDDPQKLLADLLARAGQMALDPAISQDAAELVAAARAEGFEQCQKLAAHTLNLDGRATSAGIVRAMQQPKAGQG